MYKYKWMVSFLLIAVLLLPACEPAKPGYIDPYPTAYDKERYNKVVPGLGGVLYTH
jgi:hypothetical protein